MLLRFFQLLKRPRFWIIVVPTALAFWIVTAEGRGVLMARWDLAHGRRKYKICKLPPWSVEFSERLRWFGAAAGIPEPVELSPVTLELPGPWARWYAEGYNSVSMDAVNRWWGKFIDWLACKQAEEDWWPKHPEGSSDPIGLARPGRNDSRKSGIGMSS